MNWSTSDECATIVVPPTLSTGPFQIIEDIENDDVSYEPRRLSERFGKTFLWMITIATTEADHDVRNFTI